MSTYTISSSANKQISPTYERIIELLKENPEINKSPEELIGKLIRGKYIDKWSKIYDTLIDVAYNPLDDSLEKFSKIANNQVEVTHDTSKGRTGNNTDITTFDTNVEDNGRTGTKETTTRDVNNNDSVFGFNSSTSVGNTNSVEQTTETTLGEETDNTSFNSQTKTGTESKVFGVNETETFTGTDTTGHSINETTTKEGRNSSPSKLVKEEIELRNTQEFFNIVYADIDSVAVLSIYM